MNKISYAVLLISTIFSVNIMANELEVEREILTREIDVFMSKYMTNIDDRETYAVSFSFRKKLRGDCTYQLTRVSKIRVKKRKIDPKKRFWITKYKIDFKNDNPSPTESYLESSKHHDHLVNRVRLRLNKTIKPLRTITYPDKGGKIKRVETDSTSSIKLRYQSHLDQDVGEAFVEMFNELRQLCQ